MHRKLGKGQMKFIVFKHLPFHSLMQVCMFGLVRQAGDGWGLGVQQRKQDLCWFPKSLGLE